VSSVLDFTVVGAGFFRRWCWIFLLLVLDFSVVGAGYFFWYFAAWISALRFKFLVASSAWKLGFHGFSNRKSFFPAISVGLAKHRG
jgi:hypothetical protein